MEAAQALIGFKYRPPDVEGHAYFCMDVRASMRKAVTYPTCVKLQVDADNKVLQVLESFCHCIAAAGGHCSHVSTLLFTVAQLSEPEKVIPCTSKVNQWIKPTEGATLEVHLTTSMICYKRGKCKKDHGTISQRSTYNPLGSKKLEFSEASTNKYFETVKHAIGDECAFQVISKAKKQKIGEAEATQEQA